MRSTGLAVLSLLGGAGLVFATKPMPPLEFELWAGGKSTRVAPGWPLIHELPGLLEAAEPLRSTPEPYWDEPLQGRCLVVKFGEGTAYRIKGKHVREIRVPLAGPAGFLGAAGPGRFAGKLFALVATQPEAAPEAAWQSWYSLGSRYRELVGHLEEVLVGAGSDPGGKANSEAPGQTHRQSARLSLGDGEVALGITMERAEIPRGEPVRFVFSLRNPGKAPIRVPLHHMYADRVFSHGVGSGSKAVWSDYDYGLGPGSSWEVVLAPGETLKREEVWDQQIFFGPSDYGARPAGQVPAGEYRMTLRLNLDQAARSRLPPGREPAVSLDFRIR